jgi:hypothetical protein
MVLSHPSKTRIIAEAKIIKNEIGEIERFPSYKELSSFAGLVPRVHQSANTDQTFLKSDEEVLSRTEEKEKHKDRGGGYGKEAAQGDILHANKKRKLSL